MNVFNVSNPARIMDALIELCDENTLVFLPSRRAIRAAERSFAAGRAGVLLPQFVALGESDELTEDAEPQTPRIIEYSKLVRAMFPEMSMSGALSLAAELVTMADYIETEQIPIPDWEKLVDEKYAEHFQTKAKFLNIIKNISADNTAARRRNENIKNWIGKIGDYGRVIVCGSTGSIPATRRLMAAVAMAENGMVILPGKVRRMKDEGRSETNPYFSELNFLEKIGITPDEIKTINNGESNIDFFNAAFNDTTSSFFLHPSASRIDCQHEYIESRTVADIAAAAAGNVMIVTPDAAFGTRVASELTARNIAFDNSGGTPAADTPLGRLILMLCELWTNPIDSNVVFDDIKNHPRVKNIDGIVPGNIFETLQNICEITDDDLPILSALSPALEGEFPPPLAGGVARGATGGGQDGFAILRDTIEFILKRETVRAPAPENCRVVILGTMESRMITADTVILTGLNDGVFPADGFAHPWIPKPVADEIGLPPAARKVSLMALDFITLSCGKNIYWTRSRTRGGVEMPESRFLSRVSVANPDFAKIALPVDETIPPYAPQSNAPPAPAAPLDNIWVTELDLLAHNPYAFYVKHFLRLRPTDDIWAPPDARDFGNIVHSAIENSPDDMIKFMDDAALKILDRNSVLFRFWHKRFVEIAKFISDILPPGKSEVVGETKIAGRRIRARADRVWNMGDTGYIMDIKTGGAPSATSLTAGNAPQMPLSALMMQRGEFLGNSACHPKPWRRVVAQFLQLKYGNLKLVEIENLDEIISATVERTEQMIHTFGDGGAPYEYAEVSGPQYHAYDALARVD